MVRRLASWLDAFQQYMKPFDVPPLFATWTGLVVLASAAERKVWHVTNKGELYPNIYTMLIGPAASGKTIAIHEGRQLLEELEDVHLAASNVSSASFIDELNDAKRTLLLPRAEGVVSFNSLAVLSNEFGVFLPIFDTGFLSILTDMWDGKGFSERKRKLKDKIEIPKSTVSILAGWTPSALNQFLPPGAWEQGFMSRITVVYSGAGDPQDLWSENGKKTASFNSLVTDLNAVHNIYGPMVLAPAALEALRAWHLMKGPPRPDHPKLATYADRRTSLMIKLCMLCSLSSRDTRIIELEDYQFALRILLSTEAAMPDAFKAMQTGGDMNVIKEVWYIVYQEFMRTANKPVPQRLILQLLMERTPSHNVGRLLEVMVRAQWLTGSGVEGYTPRGKRPGD
jgi:hypothetical protein